MIDWDVQQIHGGIGGGVFASAVYRLKGKGIDQGQTICWSMILKAFFPRNEADPNSPYYPRREAEAYRSGWLDDLPGCLATPACYGVIEYSDCEIWVWLEDVIDDIGANWPFARYGLAARHLGHFNGSYLVDQSRPDFPWFSKDFLRRVVAEITPNIAQLSTVLEHPLVCRYFPGDLGNRFLFLWAQRDHLLNVLNRLPNTICHFDAFSRNLFSKRCSESDQTVVIDWAFVGMGQLARRLNPWFAGVLLLKSRSFPGKRTRWHRF